MTRFYKYQPVVFSVLAGSSTIDAIWNDKSWLYVLMWLTLSFISSERNDAEKQAAEYKKQADHYRAQYKQWMRAYLESGRK